MTFQLQHLVLSYNFLTICLLLKTAFLALERKISVRANRDELIQKGILLPESPMSSKSGNYIGLSVPAMILLSNWINQIGMCVDVCEFFDILN